MDASQKKKLVGVILLGAVIWFLPHPDAITPIAWHLFAVFAATIAGFILQPLPIGAVAFIGVSVAALLGVVSDPTTPGISDSDRAMHYCSPGVTEKSGEE